MKKLIFSLAVVFCSYFAAQAQDYQSAIGVRLGFPSSLSFKHFISEKGALEGMLGFRSYSGYSWINIGGLYEHHNSFPSAEGLRWYYGGGASVFMYRFDNGFLRDDDANVSIGIMGVLGLDYKFTNAPVNLSLDWSPVFVLNGYNNGFGSDHFSLGARYTFR